MLEWAKPMVDEERLKDCLQVLIPNGAVLAAINLVPLNQCISITAGIVTIAYAVWRWRRDSYVICQACRDGRPPSACPLPAKRRPAWCPRVEK